MREWEAFGFDESEEEDVLSDGRFFTITLSKDRSAEYPTLLPPLPKIILEQGGAPVPGKSTEVRKKESGALEEKKVVEPTSPPIPFLPVGFLPVEPGKVSSTATLRLKKFWSEHLAKVKPLSPTVDFKHVEAPPPVPSVLPVDWNKGTRASKRTVVAPKVLTYGRVW